MHVGLRLAAALAIAATVSAAATAEPAGPVRQEQEERERAPRAAASARRALDAAGEAALFRALEDGERVTYADVLADPDDVTLSFRYAQTQIADGDLKGAAATLERILLVQPELSRVRLLYAIVLFRLDDLVEAEREFERLEGVMFDAATGAEIARYRDAIRKRRQRTRYAFTLSTGAQYDSNRNSAPTSQSALLADFRFDLAGEARIDDDYSYLAMAELRVEHDLPFQEGHQLFGAIGTYHSEQEKLDRFDLRSLGAEGGLLFRTTEADLRVRLYGGLIDLSSDKFVRALGLEIGAEREVSKRLRAGCRAILEYQDFDRTPNSLNGHEYTGLESALSAEGSYALSPSRRLDFGAGVHHKSADRRYYSYAGPDVTLGFTWLPGRGQFVTANLTTEWDRYKDSQTLISTKIRRDLRVRSQLMYGAPVSFLSGGLVSGMLGDMLLSVVAEHLWVSSNIPNFTYRNRRVGVMLTKAWEF